MRFLRGSGMLLCAAALVAGCTAPEAPPRSVAEFVAEPDVLNGVLLRCAERPRQAARDPDCINARVAADRLQAQHEAQKVDVRAREFERQRELRRLRDEQQRRAADAAQPKFDPYRSPVGSDAADAATATAAPAPATASTPTPAPASVPASAPASAQR